MKKIIFIVMMTVSFLLSARDIAGLQSRDPGICDGSEMEDNYYGLLECVKRVSESSEKKLQDRLVEIRRELKDVDFDTSRERFEKTQKNWEVYKKSLCEYQVSQISPDGSAYGFKLDYCNASENYRRLDALEGEPAIT